MPISFSDLWRSHPALQPDPVIEPCSANGTPYFANQCAIRLGACFVAAGVSLASYRGVFCWYGHGSAHPLRAEEMKIWLDQTADFVGTAEIARRDARGKQRSFHAYVGRQGIVMLRNFWGPGNQGDHIDLWDGSTMAHGMTDYFMKSQEIWFWEM